MKSSKVYIICFLLTAVLGCSKDNRLGDELEIKRDKRRAIFDYNSYPPRESLGENLFRAVYTVPRFFLISYGKSHDGVADPFADEPAGEQKYLSGRQWLENAGVIFGEGATASYEQRTRKLTVVQNPEGLDEVEALLESHKYKIGICRIPVRTETYRMSTADALTLVESATLQGENKPERDAARRAVQNGRAKLHATYSVTARNDGRFASLGSDQPVKNKGASPNDQTGLEVDVVLAPNYRTIDITLFLGIKSEVPNNYFARTTRLALYAGDYMLLCSWSLNDQESLVTFLTADVQFFDDNYIEAEE